MVGNVSASELKVALVICLQEGLEPATAFASDADEAACDRDADTLKHYALYYPYLRGRTGRFLTLYHVFNDKFPALYTWEDHGNALDYVHGSNVLGPHLLPRLLRWDTKPRIGCVGKAPRKTVSEQNDVPPYHVVHASNRASEV